MQSKWSWMVAVVVLVLAALAPAMARAAEVDSTAADNSKDDKVRCNIARFSSTTMGGKCYFHKSRTGFTPGTRTGNHLSAPHYLVVNVGGTGTGCSHTFNVETFGLGAQSLTFVSTCSVLPAGLDGVASAITISSLRPGFVSCIEPMVFECYLGAGTGLEVVASDLAGIPWPEDWYPDGEPNEVPAPPPVMTCSRTWNDLDDGQIEVLFVIGWSGEVAPAGVTYEVEYDPTPIEELAGTATVATVRQRVKLDRSGPTVATITATHPENDPTTSTCAVVLDESAPHVIDPDDLGATDPNGCPSGWGILNPTNILRIGKCLFIPDPDVADDLIGDGGSVESIEDPDGDYFEFDTTSLWYPVALVGSMGRMALDTIVIEDEEVGDCRLHIGWGENLVNEYDEWNDEEQIFRDFGSSSLINTELCASNTTKKGVRLVRTGSMIAAALQGVWMSVGFVRSMVDGRRRGDDFNDYELGR